MEKPLITLFVGEKQKANYLANKTTCSLKASNGSVLKASVNVYEDKSICNDSISAVSVESKGITEQETLLLMRELVKYTGKLGNAAAFYLTRNN